MIYSNSDLNIEIYPLDSSRWNDFEKLFGDRGACGGCWCMYWRLKPSEFEKLKGSRTKAAMKALIQKNEQVGLLAYVKDKPVGWCALAPREAYPRLENSRIWKRPDDLPVWSMTCFFIDKSYRNKGISLELIKAAIQYGKIHGIPILESYPIMPGDKKIPDPFAYMGLLSAFKKKGFVEVERRSASKPIMRYYLE